MGSGRLQVHKNPTLLPHANNSCPSHFFILSSPSINSRPPPPSLFIILPLPHPQPLLLSLSSPCASDIFVYSGGGGCSGGCCMARPSWYGLDPPRGFFISSLLVLYALAYIQSTSFPPLSPLFFAHFTSSSHLSPLPTPSSSSSFPYYLFPSFQVCPLVVTK